MWKIGKDNIDSLFWQLLMDILAVTLVCIASLIQEEFMFIVLKMLYYCFQSLKLYYNIIFIYFLKIEN